MSAALSLPLVLGGCSPAHAPTVDAGYCAPPERFAARWTEDPAPPSGAPRLDRARALLGIATATAGLTDPRDARLVTLERIDAARVDLSSISAELDCEGERADQIANRLAESEASATRGFTVASLIVAAAAGMTTAILQGASASTGSQVAVAASGAGVSGLLGGAALLVHRTTEYRHPRNLLADIWTGPAQPSTYPPVVWAYLSRPEFSNGGKTSIREGIVRRWKSDGLDDKAAHLYFGSGGTYDAEALHARSAMLDQVKAEVELLNQELDGLVGANLTPGAP